MIEDNKELQEIVQALTVSITKQILFPLNHCRQFSDIEHSQYLANLTASIYINTTFNVMDPASPIERFEAQADHALQNLKEAFNEVLKQIKAKKEKVVN